MKKRLWAAAGIILAIALAFEIDFLKEAHAINREAERVPQLRNILTLAENRGADWATHELMIKEIETFSKKSLYKKWGNPETETSEEDVWLLSDEFQLVVDYASQKGRIERVKVVNIGP